MKKAFLLLSVLTIFAFKAFAQDAEILKKEEASNDYYYEEVVTADGLKQDELFKRTKAWIIANLKTGDNNITFDDKNYSTVNTGAMKVKTLKSMSVVIHDGYFDFKFHVWCKDGRYKLRLDNIMFYVVVSQTMQGTTSRTYSYSELNDKKLDQHLKKDANAKLSSLVALFKQDIAKSPSEVKQSNDW